MHERRPPPHEAPSRLWGTRVHLREALPALRVQQVVAVNYLYPPDHPQGRADRHGHDLLQRTLREFENGENDDPDPSLARR
jgi:hypothetical protein